MVVSGGRCRCLPCRQAAPTAHAKVPDVGNSGTAWGQRGHRGQGPTSQGLPSCACPHFPCPRILPRRNAGNSSSGDRGSGDRPPGTGEAAERLGFWRLSPLSPRAVSDPHIGHLPRRKPCRKACRGSTGTRTIRDMSMAAASAMPRQPPWKDAVSPCPRSKGPWQPVVEREGYGPGLEVEAPERDQALPLQVKLLALPAKRGARPRPAPAPEQSGPPPRAAARPRAWPVGARPG
jgi:hypothetical protein